MLGYYDYTVILTYLSCVSAGLGIIFSLSGGHPYVGMFFLMISGLCDAFDGKVARTKKNRTENEKKYGIQIDSLSDIVAFGILPAAIASSMIPSLKIKEGFETPLKILLYIIIVLYILAALIRLAYFNVAEEDRQKKEVGNRKFYEGLPVTSAALIFPVVLIIRYLSNIDISIIYYAVMLLTGIAFISPFKVVKPGLKGILVMVGIGAVEFILLMFAIW